MIVLDTHTLIWWVSNREKLSKAAHKAIELELKNEDGQILVSSITVWEISLLIEKGRITMDLDEWLRTVSDIKNLHFIPIDNEVAMKSVRLPGDFHPDPADRMITTLARHYSAPLVTSDAKIQNYK
ncbi:MAG: type II toxin-antitoxin system VapC family toxin [gamma proteobacterium symbiont of Lucinoma myriamae]|nr:type II toxin-antitoxin system VapC family toxin [gamma proteobacterium symbiont of Lucinoma myriamae]MCU7832689.1 type II toxin-antitoxin system VapC family toxin [gamma proteobacterium symbiont of Lucinoma myriamae]